MTRQEYLTCYFSVTYTLAFFLLKVGSLGFEGTISLIILFSKLLESTFYKEISKFQQKV